MSDFKMQIAEPPASMRGGRRYRMFAAALEFARAAGGKWCLVAEHKNPSTSSAMASQWKVRGPAKHFEFASRAEQNGKGKVGRIYCRYVGGES